MIMASTRVRGITIELGADTTGLSKALKDVNTEIGKTQKELKDVDRLLKLDPKNTELLEQKQRLLGERIGETETKLEALKKAQSEMTDEFKKTEEGQTAYDALQREIISCEQELEKLQKQAIESNAALVSISQAGDKLQKVGDSVARVGDSMTRNVTMPVVAAGTAITKVAGDFEQQMSKVSAIAQAYGDDLKSLEDNAINLSKETRFSATEIAQAYEYMGMAGWKTNQILEGTPGILDLATASGEELATVSDIVTDGLTAFGLKAEDTSHFVNVLAEAARSSNTNVSMMGESFKYVGPVAGSMGYSIDDVAVALGLMANSGIKASQAGTSLRNMLQRMAKPTKESQAAMDDLGLTLTDGNGNMLSMMDILKQLRKGMSGLMMPIEDFNSEMRELDEALEAGELTEKKYSEAVEELSRKAYGAEGAEKARAAAMLGGARAMSALMAIAGAAEEDFNGLAESIQNASQTMVRTTDGAIMPMDEALAQGKEIAEEFNGTAAAMAGTMENTTQSQMKMFVNQLQALAIQLGETLLPIISDVVSKLGEWVDAFSNMSPEMQNMIVHAALLAAALGPILSIGGRLMSGIGGIMKIMPQLVSGLASVTGGLSAGATSLTALLGPIAAVVVAIGVLVAAFVHLWQTNEEFRNNITATWSNIKARFDQFGNGIVQRLNNMGFEFKNFSEVVTAAWNGMCQILAPVFEQSFKAVEAVLSGVLDVLDGMLDFWIGAFTGDWEMCWKGVKETFSGIWNAITGVFKSKMNIISSGLNSVIRGINAAGRGQISIPLIPMLADGGILSSGSAIVGEAGPELLTMAHGRAVVQPLTNNTNNYAGTTNNFYIQSSDPEQVAEEVSTILNNQMQRLQGAWA